MPSPVVFHLQVMNAGTDDLQIATLTSHFHNEGFQSGLLKSMESSAPSMQEKLSKNITRSAVCIQSARCGKFPAMAMFVWTFRSSNSLPLMSKCWQSLVEWLPHFSYSLCYHGYHGNWCVPMEVPLLFSPRQYGHFWALPMNKLRTIL